MLGLSSVPRSTATSGHSFKTSTEFTPTLTRQRDHARDHGQTDRAELFDSLLNRLGEEAS
jgi:hypothetical protein